MTNSLELTQEIKELIIQALELEDVTPEEIENDAPLFGDGLGLDSIDALELGVAIQKKYKVEFQSGAEENQVHFASVTSLANYISEKTKS
ncbi:MAG: phosphopantetheine-binding protein [SAR324 cluster bacterium]|nr:phosphopantetheine-binding protein [SAR324 cluster bacterium]